MKEERLVNLLQQGWIKSYRIEQALNLPGSEVRRMVQNLRRKGVPIASGYDGYKMAENYTEIEGTVEHLKARALSELATAQKLMNCFNLQMELEI